MPGLKYICLIVTLLAAVSAVPINTDTPDFVMRSARKMDVIEKIFKRLEKMVGDNLLQLFNRLNTLTLTTDQLLEWTKDWEPELVHGQANNVSESCPDGFKTVAGSRMCYYFSTYKEPWMFANEHCNALGAGVEMVSIQSTKQQFQVSHLIQSDADAKRVGKWWTGGRVEDVGGWVGWLWNRKLTREAFSYEYWAEEKLKNAEVDSCAYLDKEFYYQWGSGHCGKDGPAHHFICQVKSTAHHRRISSRPPLAIIRNQGGAAPPPSKS